MKFKFVAKNKFCIYIYVYRKKIYRNKLRINSTQQFYISKYKISDFFGIKIVENCWISLSGYNRWKGLGLDFFPDSWSLLHFSRCWTSVSTLARIINRERIIIEGKVGRSKTRRDIFLHVGELGTSEVAESFLRFYPGRKGAVDRKYISRKKLFMTACGTGLLLSSRFWRV